MPSENSNFFSASKSEKTFNKSSTPEIDRDPERAENSTIACTKD